LTQYPAVKEETRKKERGKDKRLSQLKNPLEIMRERKFRKGPRELLIG